MSVPSKVGVFGGGRMGGGIAHAFLVAGAHVVLVEVDDPSVEAAADRVRASVEKAAERGTLPDPVEATLSRLVATSDPSSLVDRGLVVEAVPELPDLKASVLGTIERCAPDAVLATNTSSLSIDGLASALERPDRFLGLHFFNPVPSSALVEVVVGSATDARWSDEAAQWVDALGKTAITVGDSPGFASSRLGVALALEAIRMLEDGVATAEDIDTAMTLGYRHPVGPLRTTDIVGLDVRLAIAEHLAAEFGVRFEPPQLLRDTVAAGHLGRKTGRGFYSW